MELTISFSTILVACLSFFGVYVLMPVALIARDMLVVKVINKWVLNSDFWLILKIYESDRAHLEILYPLPVSTSIEDEGHKLFIGDVEVDGQRFNDYVKGQSFHENRMIGLQPKIIFRTNLVTWLFKHYKFEGFRNPTKEYSEKFYEDSINDLKRRERSQGDLNKEHK